MSKKSVLTNLNVSGGLVTPFVTLNKGHLNFLVLFWFNLITFGSDKTSLNVYEVISNIVLRALFRRTSYTAYASEGTSAKGLLYWYFDFKCHKIMTED